MNNAINSLVIHYANCFIVFSHDSSSTTLVFCVHLASNVVKQIDKMQIATHTVLNVNVYVHSMVPHSFISSIGSNGLRFVGCECVRTLTFTQLNVLPFETQLSRSISFENSLVFVRTPNRFRCPFVFGFVFGFRSIELAHWLALLVSDQSISIRRSIFFFNLVVAWRQSLEMGKHNSKMHRHLRTHRMAE